MAKKENKYKGYDITTQAIHTGTDYDEGSVCKRDSFEADQGTDLKNVLLLSVH